MIKNTANNGNWILLSSISISPRASLPFNTNLSLYSSLLFEFVSVVPADQTNILTMSLSNNNNSTQINTGCTVIGTAAATSNSTTFSICAAGSACLGTAGFSGNVMIDNSPVTKLINGSFVFFTTTTTTRNAMGLFCTTSQSGQLNYVSFQRVTAANFNSGTVNCYGKN